MSTVVVAKKDRRVCIAADSLSTWGNLKQKAVYSVDDSKILQVQDTFIGITGSTTHKLVMHSYFSEPERSYSFKNKHDIFETWREMHEVLKEEYHLNPQDDKDDPYESTQIVSLIANCYGIFGVYPLRSVIEFTKFWAAGSGMEYALGALYSSYDKLDNVEDIVRVAVEAAAEFDDGTDLPITIHSIDLLGD